MQSDWIAQERSVWKVVILGSLPSLRAIQVSQWVWRESWQVVSGPVPPAAEPPAESASPPVPWGTWSCSRTPAWQTPTTYPGAVSHVGALGGRSGGGGGGGGARREKQREALSTRSVVQNYTTTIISKHISQAALSSITRRTYSWVVLQMQLPGCLLQLWYHGLGRFSFFLEALGEREGGRERGREGGRKKRLLVYM